MRILLYPLSLVYDLIVSVRNMLFDMNIFSSRVFDLPIISIGNLTVGGTGKTPMTEYIIRLLKSENKIATLSRGYGRKTKGFILADETSGFEIIGDEPKQYKAKYPNVTVSVSESRVKGVNNLLAIDEPPDVIILDDAFQHRQINPGLNILLTDYYLPYHSDFILPAGNLRESKRGAKRADMIIVTKSPKVLSPIVRKSLLAKINPLPYQKVYFSYIRYGNFFHFFDKNIPLPSKITTILLFSGIANPSPLEEHLSRLCSNLETIKFPDHHKYSSNNLLSITKTFHNIATPNKILVTTEKDAMRIEKTGHLQILKSMPMYVIPIEIVFHAKDESDFNRQILKYVRENKPND